MAWRTAPKLFRARAVQALAPREGGLASAQFRFDTPQLAAGSFITLYFPLKPLVWFGHCGKAQRSSSCILGGLTLTRAIRATSVTCQGPKSRILFDHKLQITSLILSLSPQFLRYAW